MVVVFEEWAGCGCPWRGGRARVWRGSVRDCLSVRWTVWGVGFGGRGWVDLGLLPSIRVVAAPTNSLPFFSFLDRLGVRLGVRHLAQLTIDLQI